ncbi:hypothetical protein [Nocardioides pantholopis]|uniref:hypothetical protein n=1 Tax=Nocardioides pantholopis TaxID=2483798 RepID=UPI000F07AC46|nr:hypothetical protein [Nocardioides pantholopis]
MPAPSPTRPARLAGTLLVLALLVVATLAVSVAGVLGTAAPAAAACTCQRTDTEAQARRAQDVFTGTVTAVDVQRAGAGQPAVITHDVTVELVYKGGLSQQVVQVVTESATPNTCGLGRLATGAEAVFMVREVEGALTAGGCSGTAPATARLVAALDRLYPNAAPPRPEQEPVEADFERVGDLGAPTPVTRALAPGAALVLVGLLGLALVRRLGRQR